MHFSFFAILNSPVLLFDHKLWLTGLFLDIIRMSCLFRFVFVCFFFLFLYNHLLLRCVINTLIVFAFFSIFFNVHDLCLFSFSYKSQKNVLHVSSLPPPSSPTQIK